jgi:DNA-binding XRE family transcriptional regulator
MGRKLSQIIEGLPKSRRDAIEKRAAKISEEMVQASLQELRKAADKTQAQIAAAMGLAQNAISQIESRPDMLLSTLNRYVDAVGGRVMVVVELRDGKRFQIRKDAPTSAMHPGPELIQVPIAARKAGSPRKAAARRAR